MSREPEIGVGLWSMQVTPPRGRGHIQLYEELRHEAHLVEKLGFDSLWVSEHHGWFDGYCPAATVAAASALGATGRLRVGTAVTLLPLHHVEHLATSALELHALSGGRFVLGVAAGYRSEEFEAFGVPRERRGALMDQHLAGLAEVWGGADGPEVLVGAASEAAATRAARHGAGILLPPPVAVEKVRAIVAAYHAAGGTGRVGVMRDLCVAETADEARRAAEPWLWYAHTQYAAMEGMGDEEEIRAFAERSTAASIVGTPDDALEQLSPLLATEPDLLLFRVRWGDQPTAQVAGNLTTIAHELAPAIRKVST